MEAKEFLQSYKRTQSKIKLTEDYIEKLKSEAQMYGCNITSEKVQQSGINDRVGNLAVRICEEKERRQEQINTLFDDMKEIVDVIMQIEDERINKVLYFRYIKDMSWDEIADEMHYDNSWVRQLGNDGLEMVQNIIAQSSESKVL